jgi:ATP-dependent DNA helicase DinG
LAQKNRKSAEKQPVAHRSLDWFFGPSGPLSTALEGYEVREQQVEAAKAVEHAMSAERICMIEAGTGVGKSMAYLVPAIRAALQGKRTVISTHTINLQHQLINTDIPLALSLFPEAGDKVHATTMKGRGNFLCKLEHHDARNNLFLLADPQFPALQKWISSATWNGDVADLPFSFPAWTELSSTLDTCKGKECSFYGGCYYYDMRWYAAECQIIVVNHALFLSDLQLRASEAEGGLIPPYDCVVFDEAHHLEDVATTALGIEFGSRRISSLTDRIRHVRGLDIDKNRLKTLDDLSDSLFSSFDGAQRQEFFLEEIFQGESQNQLADGASAACAMLSEVQNELLEAAKNHEELKDRLDGLARMCGRTKEELQTLVFHEDESCIKWGQVSSYGRGPVKQPMTTLHLTPVSVADRLKALLWEPLKEGGSAILTSATIANSGGFSYLRSRLGIPEDSDELVVGSPFNYKEQALLYVPAHLPPPERSGVDMELLVDEIVRLVDLSKGRAFLLFTSRTAMNKAYDLLKPRVPYELFKQGDMPPGKLVEAFRKSGNGCLLGVQSFWEGVDVRGDALSVVVIDKLPFAVPDSPVTRARTQAIQQAGGDWFTEYSIPQAQIRLKQGFGRLIRTRTDRGIVCILDSRILTKGYGAEFVKYLPQASRASKWNRVERFWNGTVSAETASASSEEPDAAQVAALAE